MPLQARTEFAAALNQIASEKGVDVNVVIAAIEQAALAAYRKDLSLRSEPIPEDFEELKAYVNPTTGGISIRRGEENITPPGFARIAAQTAKQVITQRLHEAEKSAIMDEYHKKISTVISGQIQRQEGNTYYVDLGRAEGVMPPFEQTKDEVYLLNQRLKFYIKEIREGSRGPEVIVSRSDPGLVKGLFAIEVPEIQTGSVEIKEVAREAGGRTKVAVVSHQQGVDPVGSLVGQKGVRVQTVSNELGEEKIDIITYYDEADKFIAAALSPAKDVQVSLDEKLKVAKVKVSTNQLSLAIGKGGQNVRLAAKLTGWKIDIEGAEQSKEIAEAEIDQSSEVPFDLEGNPIPATVETPDEQAGAEMSVIEKVIDEALEKEAGGQPEPTSEELSKSVVDAEKDTEKEDKKTKKAAGKADKKKD